jgi:hypothetical protein
MLHREAVRHSARPGNVLSTSRKQFFFVMATSSSKISLEMRVPVGLGGQVIETILFLGVMQDSMKATSG